MLQDDISKVDPDGQFMCIKCAQKEHGYEFKEDSDQAPYCIIYQESPSGAILKRFERYQDAAEKYFEAKKLSSFAIALYNSQAEHLVSTFDDSSKSSSEKAFLSGLQKMRMEMYQKQAKKWTMDQKDNDGDSDESLNTELRAERDFYSNEQSDEKKIWTSFALNRMPEGGTLKFQWKD